MLTYGFIVTVKKSTNSGLASTSSRASSISTLEIENIIDQLKRQQHWSTTQKNYYNIWKSFNKFFIKLDRKPKDWGARLTLFVAHLINNKRQSSTVKSYISAIKAVLKINNIKINEDQFLLTSLTKACRLHYDRVTTRLPVGKGMLGILLRRVNLMYNAINQPYLATLFTTMLCTAYYGLFRISEIAFTGSGHTTLACNVHIAKNKEKFLFVLESSKTHRKGS